MRRLIIIIFVFIPVYLTAQWEIVHHRNWGYYTSLDLVNDTLGFITTEEGYILKTNDGGLNWEECNKLNWPLSNIQFIDENNGWVISYPSLLDSMRLLKTVNGGKTWSTLVYNVAYFLQYQFVNPEKGWATKFSNDDNNYSKLVFTLNGGESWNDIDIDTAVSEVIRSFRFVNENVGWVIGAKDYDYVQKDLYKTEDSGVSWTKLSYQNEIQKIIPVTDSVCYVVSGSFIHKTIDGGGSWNIYPQSQDQGRIKIWDAINDSTFIFTQTGLSQHAPDIICKTTDGFKTFEIVHEFGGIGGQGNGAFWTPSYVDLFDSTNGIALNNSFVMRTSNQGNSWNTILSIGEAQTFYSVDFLSNQVGFISNGNGELLKTIDGGKVWTEINYSDSLNWLDHIGFVYYPKNALTFEFLDEGIGFVGGVNKIFRTLDGGENWIEYSIEGLPNNIGFRKIYFINDQKGWLLFNTRLQQSLLYKTIDTGETWEVQLVSNHSGNIYDIEFINEKEGFLVADNRLNQNMVYSTKNGGDIWDYELSEKHKFVDIDQLTPTLGFACGGSVIFCSKDGWGEFSNWEKQYDKPDAYLNSIYMIDSLTGYVCGINYNEQYDKYGYILKTTDGGVNWEENYSIIDCELNDIQFIDDNTGWAVGENGLVLRTTNGGVTWVDYETPNIPNKVVLHQNYPNPFNPNTIIKYQIPRSSVISNPQRGERSQDLNNTEIPKQAMPAGRQVRDDITNVSLKIYDILGREVATLVNEKQKPGFYEVAFNASDLTSGIYFYRLQTSEYVETKKMLMIK